MAGRGGVGVRVAGGVDGRLRAGAERGGRARLAGAGGAAHAASPAGGGEPHLARGCGRRTGRLRHLRDGEFGHLPAQPARAALRGRGRHSLPPCGRARRARLSGPARPGGGGRDGLSGAADVLFRRPVECGDLRDAGRPGLRTEAPGRIGASVGLLGRLFEVHILRATARTLLDTYLGRRSGGRVLEGSIRRGDGEEIEAAVRFADLRGSTAMAERLPRGPYPDALNAFSTQPQARWRTGAGKCSNSSETPCSRSSPLRKAGRTPSRRCSMSGCAASPKQCRSSSRPDRSRRSRLAAGQASGKSGKSYCIL